ncbi:MAG: ArsI/CadI family heavy metal resistance metalloenzyme [Gemmataceae bacterium]
MSVALATATAVRFHLSLNVRDLKRSVAFYRVLLGVDPAKVRADYAKFETDEPPVVLSLEPTPPGPGGALNHLGFRLSDAGALVAMQERLAREGISTKREDGVECCYARQTKFWVHDPDGTLWEVYTLDEDIEHRGAGQAREAVLPPTAPAAPAVWEHRLGQPVPLKAAFADASLDEVRLRGSLNVPLPDADAKRLFAEARRVLRPGGRLFVHTLVAERPTQGPPNLTGAAAYVQHTPFESEPLALAEAAGLVRARLVKYDAGPCFVRDGVGLREQQLEAFAPRAAGRTVSVLYKGPFRQVTDEAGNVYPRGQRVAVDAAAAERLDAEAFLVLG